MTAESVTKHRGRITRHNRPPQEQEALRVFEGMRVVEATEPLMFSISSQDVAAAVPGDPTACAAANACHRLFNSTAMVILRTVAYIDMETDTGERVVYRFGVPEKTLEKVIRPNDERGRAFPGVFKFTPPLLGRTLEYQAKTKAREHARRREAKIKGELYVPQHKGGRGGERGVAASGAVGLLRDGSGMVHVRVVHGKPHALKRARPVPA